MKNEFRYPSRDGVTEIHAIEWKPEGEVKAVLQICHGMVEYIGRYDAFAFANMMLLVALAMMRCLPIH